MTPAWRKSSHSHGSDSDCVELASFSLGIGVRDSKAPQTGHLVLLDAEFGALLACVKADCGAQSEP
ncbi:DUF397 domain-containing protein [Actinomadura logoneensis]|uniref:DUF397 domain-containing protein n=1 Tax=Actinomadura logoneensis TaxID=2293572 RepID=A0A372JJU9_9ACTN|nr:DUF397 domain-containing protein [Actinomadura logoneensis]RFU40291.1 DUF397 domain-containing protein [Actinomadura logoneensis]